MKVILRQNYENLGSIGETVEVKNGYARNFLIPRDIAYRASDGALRAIESEKKRYTIKMAKLADDARAKAALLENVSVTLGVRVGEDERVFGSITSAMIADELTRQGHNIDRRIILLPEPIKSLGAHEVQVKLHAEVIATLKVLVVDKKAEAQ